MCITVIMCYTHSSL